MDKNLIRLEHSGSFHNKIFMVNWNMTNICNFSCPYCNIHDGSRKWPDYKTVISFIDKICAYYMREKKTIYFQLTGGEITLNRDLFKIADYLHQKGCWVGLISNGSQSKEYWEKLKDGLDFIYLSFHPQFMKKEHFINVVELLHNEVTTHVNIMMESNSFEICKDVGREISERINNISMSYQPLVKALGSDYTLFDYTREQLDEIMRLEKQKHIACSRKMKTIRGTMKEIYNDGFENEINQPELLAAGKNNWIGWNCWAGLESIGIKQEIIYRSVCCRQDEIGNIRDENISFPCGPVVCRTNNCTDFTTTKRINLKNIYYFENEEMRKFKLNFLELDWTAASDSVEGGKSIAKITEVSGKGLKGKLIVRLSQLGYYYSIISFPWNFQIDFIVKGLLIKMNLTKAKILTIQCPIYSVNDYDHYQTQIIGEGEQEYVIDFNNLRQQGFGVRTEWNATGIKEIQFINEYYKNEIDIEIKEIYLLY